MEESKHRTLSFQRNNLLRTIESIILSVLKEISIGKDPNFKVLSPSKPSTDAEESLNAKKALPSKIKLSSFQKNYFVRYLVVLQYIFENIVRDAYVTKRDIYYSNVNLFNSQTITDRIVETWASTFQVMRNDLHIISSEKGLVLGPLKMRTHENKVINCMENLEGTAIPQLIEELMELKTSADYVLLIEKHTIFNYLAERMIHKKHNCLLATGKGYPDLGTRLLIKRISQELKIPIYGLVDPDIHGSMILLTYCEGSASMSYLAEKIKSNSIQWIGVDIQDVPENSRIPLTSRDEKLLEKMLYHPFLSQPSHNSWLHHLKTVKQYSQKGEMEGILTKTDLMDYILAKIQAKS